MSYTKEAEHIQTRRRLYAKEQSNIESTHEIQSRLERHRLEKAKARLKAATTLIMIFFLVKGFFYLFITPPWQAPDESFHMSYAMSIAGEPVAEKSHESVIIESMARWDFWRYQMQVAPDPLPFGFSAIPFFSTIGALERAPLYYHLVSPLIWMTEGVPVETRLYLLRFINLMLGAVTVLLTYLLAKALFPQDRFLTLAPVFFVAVLPQFSFITTSFSNDAMINMLFAVFITIAALMCVRGFNWTRLTLLLLVIAVSLMVKRSAVAMIIITLLIPFFMVLRHSGRKLTGVFMVLAAETGIIIVVASVLTLLQPIRAWIRSILKVHIDITTLQEKFNEFFNGAAMERLSFNLRTVVESFWAHFGWMNIPLDPWAYCLPWAVLFMTGIGFFWGIKSLRGYLEEQEPHAGILVFLLLIVLTVFGFGLVRTSIYEFVPFQGRYMFPALPAIAVLVSWGFRSFFPNTDYRKLFAVFALVMFGFELIALGGFMIPGYYFI